MTSREREFEHVLGRRERDGDGPTGRIGTYRARDGSAGAPVGVDLNRPHAALVVGKRGYGKSYTLGVLAEEAARADGVAPVIADPMGAFTGLESGELPAEVIESPTVRADAVPPPAWPDLVGLPTSDPAGALVWRAASECTTLASMRACVADAEDDHVGRTAANHLRLAASWGAFDPSGLSPADIADGTVTVLDLSGLDPAPANAVIRAVARGLYDARVQARVERLPWLLVDEAHTFFDGVAAPALRALLTRGRAPGVSLVAATQRPNALPKVAVSQADLLFVHRLTAGRDIEALARAEPTYLGAALESRLPTAPGRVLVVDDATESVHAVAVRERTTPHGGGSPRAVDAASPGASR